MAFKSTLCLPRPRPSVMKATLPIFLSKCATIIFAICNWSMCIAPGQNPTFPINLVIFVTQSCWLTTKKRKTFPFHQWQPFSFCQREKKVSEEKTKIWFDFAEARFAIHISSCKKGVRDMQRLEKLIIIIVIFSVTFWPGPLRALAGLHLSSLSSACCCFYLDSPGGKSWPNI